MRLLWLSHLVPFPPKGGLLQRSYYLLREASRRYEVDLAALVQPAHQKSQEELARAEASLSKLCRDVDTFWIRSDLQPWGRVLLHGKTLFSSRPYDINWLDVTELREHLQERTMEYDLVHVDTLGLTPYTSLMSDTPFVLNHHNVESQMMADRANQERNPAKRFYMKREARKLVQWEREWAARASVNLVVSPLDRQRLRERYEKAQTAIVENGVDVEYFQPRTPPEDHDGYLIFVGGMSWYPNRDAMKWFVQEIWPRLKENDPNRRAKLIGRSPPGEVRRAALGGGIEAPGFVDDVRPSMDRALAYVCPIRKGGGTRLKILDALAMAKPLVATEFAVEGLGLEEGTHYLRAENPEEFARQVERLEKDEALRHRLGEAGRKMVERRYAWGVIGKHLDDAYTEGIRRGTNTRNSVEARP